MFLSHQFIARCNIIGLYKRIDQEYKNILILTFNRFATRSNQGDRPAEQPFSRISRRTGDASASLLMPDCLRHNRSFPPAWAQISVFSLRKQRHGNT
jgi:hypothetical protein